MYKKCGKCEKTVYPTEELKCLDKSWHKGCFRCWECGMALNMRNYKGFNRLPYCEAHIPKPKATTMAETPELARIAEISKIQSNVKYHADFEASKGKFTTITDDPETLRIRQNSKIISNVAYHGDIERKAVMDQMRQLSTDDPPEQASHSKSSQMVSSGVPAGPDTVPPPPAPQYTRRPSASVPRDAELASDRTGAASNRPTDWQNYQQQQQQQQQQQPPLANVMSSQRPRQVGSIHDYDPINRQYGSQQQQQQQQQLARSQQRGPPHPSVPQQQQQQQHLHQQQQQQPHYQQQQQQPQHYQQQQQQKQSNSSSSNNNNGYQQHVNQTPGASTAAPTQPPQTGRQPSLPYGRCYRAIFDYDAADYDEITFRDGDLIVDCQPIDQGWMTGTCQRTGQRGMLPANYVQPCQL